MEVMFFHKDLTPQEIEFFGEYINKKLPKIENLMTTFEKSEPILKISIEKFKKHGAFEVEFQLKLPTKSLVAKEASHSINKAVDFSKDRLVSQIKKHIDILRNQRDHGTIRKADILKSKFETKKF